MKLAVIIPLLISSTAFAADKISISGKIDPKYRIFAEVEYDAGGEDSSCSTTHTVGHRPGMVHKERSSKTIKKGSFQLKPNANGEYETKALPLMLPGKCEYALAVSFRAEATGAHSSHTLPGPSVVYDPETRRSTLRVTVNCEVQGSGVECQDSTGEGSLFFGPKTSKIEVNFRDGHIF
jgi:hypothetical protein